MPTLAYHVVDVFTDRPFAGNPLAVVLDADDLPTEALQAIALEFHLSETAFPMRSSVAEYRLRIFTPVAELPFAGHPSVGAAWLLARLGRIRPGLVRQECRAGVLPVEVTGAGATLTGGLPSIGPELAPTPLLPLLGLDAEALTTASAISVGSDPAGPRVAGAGISFVFVPVRHEAISALAADLGGIGRLVQSVGATGVSVFSWDATACQARARVFVPGIGEDPATGAAALGLGLYLAAAGWVPDDQTTSYTIRQGDEIGRPSLLECTVTRAAGAVTRTTVSGTVVPVATGEITRP